MIKFHTINPKQNLIMYHLNLIITDSVAYYVKDQGVKGTCIFFV